MPVFHAVMKVDESEGIERIIPVKDRTWGLCLQCASCNDEPTSMMYINSAEHYERDGGTHNFVYKCKLCRAEITVDVLLAPLRTGYYSAVGDNPANVIVSFEIRGGRPVELEIDNQWVVVAEGGASFEDVDLSAEWYEYDEGSNVPVSIKGVSISFEKAKK